MLPAFNVDGNLPEGIHRATDDEVLTRFTTSTARRKWLGEQLRSLLAMAKSTGKLERAFLWGSFVTEKALPNDLDVLLVVAADFSLDWVPAQCEVLFHHALAKIHFHADVFCDQSERRWRYTESLAGHVSNRQGLQTTRHRGGHLPMIENDDQLGAAQKSIANLQKVLLGARKVHSPQEYRLLSEPILLELQQREQEILEYLSRSDVPVS